MSGFLRMGLVTVAFVGLASAALRLSGYWERLSAAYQRFEEGFQLRFMDGPLGPFVARHYAPFNAWLYAAYARGLDVQPDDEILSVACGSGVFLAKHATVARHIAGIDQSRAMIDQARKENRDRVADGSAEFVVGDAAALPWDEDTFTIVTSNDVNCYEAKAAAALTEMHRVLRPGGRAVVGMDRCEAMEAAGFSRVSGRRVLLMYLTTGYKDRATG